MEPLVQTPRGRSQSGPGLTQREVALIMRISERAVRDIERRAIDKLRNHPAVRAIWRELVGESVTSTVDLELTDAEVAAVYDLAWTPDEQRALDKLITIVRA